MTSARARDKEQEVVRVGYEAGLPVTVSVNRPEGDIIEMGEGVPDGLVTRIRCRPTWSPGGQRRRFPLSSIMLG